MSRRIDYSQAGCTLLTVAKGLRVLELNEELLAWWGLVEKVWPEVDRRKYGRRTKEAPPFGGLEGSWTDTCPGKID